MLRNGYPNGFASTVGLNTLRESWLRSASSLPLAGEITEGEQAVKNFLNSLLEKFPRHQAQLASFALELLAKVGMSQPEQRMRALRR